MGLNMAEWILTSSVLMVMIFLIRRLLKKQLSAKFRYGIWFLVLVRLLLPVSLFSSEFGLLGLIPASQQTSGKGFYGNIPAASQGMLPDLDLSEREESPRPGAVDPASPVNGAEDGLARLLSGRGSILWGIWGAGMAVTALILVGSNLLFYRKLFCSRRRFGKAEKAFAENTLPVYLTEVVPVPCMAGFLRPAIYIREQDAGDEKSLSYILRHEYTHYLHGDHIWSLLRGICLILHWYHPLVWAAAYCSKQDAELACDESVVGRITAAEAQEYGKVLLSLTLCNPRRLDVLSCATTFGGGKRYLKERISRIAQRPQKLLIPAAAAVLLCGAALFFTFTGGRKSPGEEGAALVSSGQTKEESMSGSQEPPGSQEGEEASAGGETLANGEPQAGENAQGDGNPSAALAREDLVLYAGGEEEESEIFVRDYPADMNGDGIPDVLRLSSLQWSYESWMPRRISDGWWQQTTADITGSQFMTVPGPGIWGASGRECP